MLKLRHLAVTLALFCAPCVAIAVDPPMVRQSTTPEPKRQQTNRPAMPKGVYFIGNTDDSAHYSDAKDIEVIGGERNIWTTTVYKNEISGTKYAVRLHRVQCGSKKLGAIQSTRYARSGSVEGSAGSTPLEYAVPGSIGESIVSFACNPAQEVASKNVSRVPTGVSVIEYTDYLIFVAEQPKHCFTDAHMMRALGLAELAKEMEKKCIEESQSNSPTEPSSGLY